MYSVLTVIKSPPSISFPATNVEPYLWRRKQFQYIWGGNVTFYNKGGIHFLKYIPFCGINLLNLKHWKRLCPIKVNFVQKQLFLRFLSDCLISERQMFAVLISSKLMLCIFLDFFIGNGINLFWQIFDFKI